MVDTGGVVAAAQPAAARSKKGDFSRRLRTGLALIIFLVLPMAYSPALTSIVLYLGVIAGAIEWLVSGASWIGLALWIVPALLALPDGLGVWPGQGAVLEVLWVVLVYSDSAQLVMGRRFGRTPAIPSISPNKSLEGYVLGLAIAFVLATLVHGWPPVPTVAILLGGVFGDLYFSYFKRKAGLKDFSNLLGAHGGLCDRIDSFVFGALALVAWGIIGGESAKLEFSRSRVLG